VPLNPNKLTNSPHRWWLGDSVTLCGAHKCTTSQSWIRILGPNLQRISQFS